MEKFNSRERRRRGGARRGRPRKPRNDIRAGPEGDGPSSSAAISSPSQQTPISSEVENPLDTAVPLHSRKFADLAGSNLVDLTILQTITDDLKFIEMTPVQAASIDELLPPKRRDCLVQAKTGTGKTIAFLLPALQTMLNRIRGPDAGVSLLVIAPTRELALQISTEATNLLQRLPRYRVCTAIGGTNKTREEKHFLNGCDILIATPGRLLDHLSNEDIVYSFRNLDTLVLDEADRLLDMGFMKALRDIVSRLPDKTKTNRQGMLFSATMGKHVEQAAGLVLSPGYFFVSTIPAGEINTHKRVPQLLIEVPSFASVAPAMVGCVREEFRGHEAFKAIIFSPTAALADLYGYILSTFSDLPPVSILHSRMSQNKRTNIVNNYRESKSAILVATDVVARGMDFPSVTSVIQVGIPADKESYIHRLGRTARAGAGGRGIFIVCQSEAWFPKWTLKDITFVPHDADLSSTSDVDAAVVKMEDSEKARIYQAWLGYYNNHLKGLKWDKAELVAQANVYARDGLNSSETPTIAKSTASKMGLRGTKGLVVVPDPPRLKRGQSSRR